MRAIKCDSIYHCFRFDHWGSEKHSTKDTITLIEGEHSVFKTVTLNKNVLDITLKNRISKLSVL